MDYVAEHDRSRVFAPVPEAWNVLSRRVIGCAMEVHSILGPGHLERIYEEAMAYELQLNGILFVRQHPIRLSYKQLVLPEQRLDLIVDNLLVVELKATDGVPNLHLAQLTGYLRATDLPLGLLINFNVASLKSSLYRRINPHASAIQALPLPRSPLSHSGPSDSSESGSI